MTQEVPELPPLPEPNKLYSMALCSPPMDYYTVDQMRAAREALTQAVADAQRLRDALLETARRIENLKKPCSMDDPESPQAIRNGTYMSIALYARESMRQGAQHEL
jgi:hypothetical protein